MRSTDPINQPQPPDPAWPRYTRRPFPLYRFVPGVLPHPRRSPQGHSFGHPEPVAHQIEAAGWRASETYLYAIDLYNYAYWWECHEQFEALWHAAGHDTRQRQFFQGLVQIAAANLRRFMDRNNAVAGLSLSVKGLRRLAKSEGVYMGIDVDRFRSDVHAYFEGTRVTPPLITLVSNQSTSDGTPA